MLPQSRFVNTFPTPPPLRLSTDPPAESYRERVGALFAELHRGLLWWAFVRTEDWHMAEDAVANTYLRLLESSDIEIANVRAFVFGVCRGQIRNLIANRFNQRTRRSADFRDARHEPVAVSRGERPESVAQHRELVGLVNAAISDLPPRLQDVRVKVFDGIERGEAGKTLGCSEREAQYRLWRGLNKLQKKFADLRPQNKPNPWRLTNGHRSTRDLPVWCVDLRREFDNFPAAAAAMNVTPATIRDACNGHSATAAGFRWRWSHLKDPVVIGAAEPTPEVCRNGRLDRRFFDLYCRELDRTFATIREAAAFTSLSTCTISHA
ncbi:MAG TPA: RNA polymerase sigma factor, partial [Tepidisphaeraceae bacterium]